MKTLFAALILLLPLFTQAMPCDVSTSTLSCKSASGKYQFFARFCGFDSLVRTASLTVSGKVVDKAALDNVWAGAAFYGFNIGINVDGDQERNVVIELNRATGSGTIVDKVRDGNPAPWQETASEKIRCVEKAESDN